MLQIGVIFHVPNYFFTFIPHVWVLNEYPKHVVQIKNTEDNNDGVNLSPEIPVYSPREWET